MVFRQCNNKTEALAAPAAQNFIHLATLYTTFPACLENRIPPKPKNTSLGPLLTLFSKSSAVCKAPPPQIPTQPECAGLVQLSSLNLRGGGVRGPAGAAGWLDSLCVGGSSSIQNSPTREGLPLPALRRRRQTSRPRRPTGRSGAAPSAVRPGPAAPPGW